MRFKNKQIQLWYILPNSKDLKKIEIDLIPIGIFFSVIILSICFFFTWGFLASDSAISQTKKHFAYALGNLKLKNLKAERNVLKEKNLFLEEELDKVSDINEQYVEYGNNLDKRNQALAKLIEDTTHLGIFNNEITAKGGGVGGVEIDDINKPQKKSFNINNLDIEKKHNLIKNIDKINDAIETLPIGLPVNARISSNFGIRRSPFTGRYAKHLGIDFPMRYGSRIRATGMGRVIRANYSRTYGYVVDIMHKDNVISRYAHLSKILVKEGNLIHRGELLGLVGSTGRSTGSHLHYELRVNNRAINPISFINLASYLSTNLEKIKTAREF